MKPTYCSSNPTHGSAERDGKIAFARFLNPPDENEAMPTIVMMNKVLWQDDLVFKRALLEMSNGNTTDSDVDFLLSRFVQNLPEQDHAQFNDALQLVSTWAIVQQIKH